MPEQPEQPEQEATDLVRLCDDEGNSVVVRVTGRDTPGVLTGHDTLVARIVLTTGFVGGHLDVRLSPRVLTAWDTALDALAAGRDIRWLMGHGPEVRIRVEGERGCPEVVVEDVSMSMVTVVVPVAVEENWVEDHRRRLEDVRRRWPEEVTESSSGVYEWRASRPAPGAPPTG
ncbi:DUF5959 family protein [Streptomyces sp. MST-110588]|uniref:DUF5959 family protein n=1 Tax=Streptomyces sp. MST-110588 TaxID=2833628 RepID=UPI001F5C6928|nr:DUF5959 family protein [Streptomyces sp. MST-110588]UNO38817.1 hypothetical protein KGS77_03125 [Streptomyces sp. MST-110588]